MELAIRTQYQVIGIDCADDAAEIGRAVRAVAGVHEAHVSTASQMLTLTALKEAHQVVPEVVSALGYELLEVTASTRPSAHVSASYARALWMVVLLNVGYGSMEMVGGFLADSQALKADALDFLGDGLITLLGVLALSWALMWRARAALLQGLFLGALGVGVIANTMYRVIVRQSPEPELMGLFGLAALLVNVLAAYVLIPHRAGDANVRAVWLFSRNDAIGNAAVVIAAGLVAWTKSPWPDLAVAIVIATLFLHSSSIIVRDASNDLREADMRSAGSAAP